MNSTSDKAFKRVEQRPDFPGIGNRILARWKKEQAFEESLKRSKGRPEFVFYDGPPFPTGNPHHGTIFVSVIKDLIPRYKTMRGFYVPRAWGWDCHGLPIETIAEKNLGIKDKTEIGSRLSVAEFNAECKRVVSTFNDSWKTYIDRIGRWVDFDHPYRTLDRNFMESVMWSFSEVYKKGYIYKDYRVSPYCYRCQTPLSLSDIRLDDSTRPRQDRTATVKFKANVAGADFSFLVWTTTPWTLPSNLALAVGPEISYVIVEHASEKLLLAEGCLKNFAKELGKTPKIIQTMTGAELLAKEIFYEPIFPYFSAKNPKGFKLLAGDFVTTDDGTGIVHLAPAFGEDDYWLCRKNGIAVQNPVDEQGNFTSEIAEFAGKNVHEANGEIIRWLKDHGFLFRDQTIEHNYPHCWRCRNAVIYKALDAWYLSVEKLKDDLLKNNQEINWYPDSVKNGRFGKWLENARDWNISRNRFWATPIPVWECDSCGKQEVFGSVAQLEEKAQCTVPDLHKEFLDPIRFACGCEKKGTMQRVPEVLDGWFESGSMPYGQYHYPFENKEYFKEHFPCDYIVEYVGQVRGWFYTLHVLSTALFGRAAFKSCSVTGTLLAADGKKISKSLKNYTDPMELIEKYGADALRAYMLSSVTVCLEDSNFKDEGIEECLRSINLPLWNALLFFTTYAEVDQISEADLSFAEAKKHLNENDRYILSELELLRSSITEKMDRYDIDSAMREFPVFLDTLNNWYIRRSRPRVWSKDPRAQDKVTFYAVLYRVLTTVTKLLAPFCPFIAEAVWEGLRGAESVHYQSWPEADESLVDIKLSKEIAVVRRIITAGLAVRAREKIRVRQPLSELQLALEPGQLSVGTYLDSIKEELNVKSIVELRDASLIAERVGRPNAKLLGPRFGGDTQRIIKLIKDGAFESLANGGIKVDGHELSATEVEISYVAKPGLAVESTRGAVVGLNTNVTPELALEGDARDLVRQIQEMRREAGLNVSDRIRLTVKGADELLTQHKEYLMSETLAVGLDDSLTKPIASQSLQLGDRSVTVELESVVSG